MSSSGHHGELPTPDEKGSIRDGSLNIHDASRRQIGSHCPEGITFQEYVYYADLQRKAEAERYEPSLKTEGAKSILMRVRPEELTQADKSELTDLEIAKVNAQRMLRQAGWASVFFLITTDILGPFNAPYAISANGYVPGVILYTIFGAAAAYTGIILSYLYCKMDSDYYPIRTFGDLSYRLFNNSKIARHLTSILQSLQLIINVGTICLSNGQSLSQITKGNLCFAVCIVIWSGVGMVMGQIRHLSNFTKIANISVWLNLLLIFISMGVIANSKPNYASAVAAYGISAGPVHTEAFYSGPLFTKINGMMNMVFAYGGAMIFLEFMAEMRRPWDFWKGMAAAQGLIYTVYLTYGVVIYSQQGQFTLGLAYQGIASYGWQTLGNVFALITGIIAAVLYGNIGIKVAYMYFIEDWLKGPPLTSKAGIKIWFVMCCVYWALAFVVGAAIPQVQTISGLVAAICILQFSYTLPFLYLSVYQVVEDASKADEPFTPGGPPPRLIDTWGSGSRWKRGIIGNGIMTWRFFSKSFNFILFLASLTTACLGMYGSGKAIQETFKVGAATSFGCTPPV